VIPKAEEIPRGYSPDFKATFEGDITGQNSMGLRRNMPGAGARWVVDYRGMAVSS